MDKNKTFITKDVAEKADLKELQLQTAQKISTDSPFLLNNNINKETPIYIYDLGFNLHKKIIPINNHINKTGTNPLRDKPQKKIEFYDITTIYQNQKQAKTAECFGRHKPPNQPSKYIQTRFLCNYVIAAHCMGFKKIFAYVID